jgi:hypothetical protein
MGLPKSRSMPKSSSNSPSVSASSKISEGLKQICEIIQFLSLYEKALIFSYAALPELINWKCVAFYVKTIGKNNHLRYLSRHL